MLKTLAATLLVVLVLPSVSFSGSSRYGPRQRYWKHYRPYAKPTTVYEYRNNGAAIAAGVLGGIVTGVILDRLLAPSRQSQPVQSSCCQGTSSYYRTGPVNPREGDPHYEGYQRGYQEGVEQGRVERYRQGQQQGYDQGLDDAASGRIWTRRSP